MVKNPKLKKICHYCNTNFEVTRNKKTQKFCSHECASYSTRKRSPLFLKKRWSKDQDQESNKHNPPFHKSSEEVALAVQKFLASGRKIKTLTSPSVTKEVALISKESDLEEIRQVTRPLNRDRSMTQLTRRHGD